MKTIEEKIEAIITKSLKIQRLQFWLEHQHIESFSFFYGYEGDDEGHFHLEISRYDVILDKKVQPPAPVVEVLKEVDVYLVFTADPKAYEDLYYLEDLDYRQQTKLDANAFSSEYPIKSSERYNGTVCKPNLTVKQIQQRIEALCQDI